MSNLGRIWLVGILGLILLAFGLLAPFGWQIKMACWIVITLLLDDLASGWFAYLAMFAGLGVFAYHPPQQWWEIAPMVLSALWAYLLVKHSLPRWGILLAAVLYAAPFVGVYAASGMLDDSVRLVKNSRFILVSMFPMLVCTVLSIFLRRRQPETKNSQSKSKLLPRG